MVALSSDAFRMKHQKQGQPECPQKVEVNTKGDCIDAGGVIVPDDCCDDHRNCQVAIENAMQYYNERLKNYLEECELKQSDIRDGKLVDDTRICSTKCQSMDSSMVILRSLQSWFGADSAADCKTGPMYERLEQMWTLAESLSTAWKDCRLQTPSPSPSPEVCATDCDGACDFAGEWDEVGDGARGCVPSNTIHGTDKRWVVSQSGQNIINAHCPGYADHMNRENLVSPPCFQIWGRRMCINPDKNLMYGPNGIVWHKRGSAVTDTTWKDTSGCNR